MYIGISRSFLLMTDSFRLKRSDIFLGGTLKFGESGDSSFVRIGQKNNSWSRPVHEVWDAQNERELTVPLTHHTAKTVAGFVDKLNFYATINAQHLFEQKTPIKGWHIVAYPAGKFLQNYIVKQGYRDGVHGFLHAVFMSFHSFLTRSKLWL